MRRGWPTEDTEDTEESEVGRTRTIFAEIRRGGAHETHEAHEKAVGVGGIIRGTKTRKGRRRARGTERGTGGVGSGEGFYFSDPIFLTENGDGNGGRGN